MKKHVDLLFGTARANRLRSLVSGMDPAARETLVIEEFAAVAKGDANAHVLPFRFSSSLNAKTSHYLFFVSRHPLGLKIAKDIMAAESQTDAHGFPTFEFDPKPPPAQGELPLLLEPSPLEMLEQDLVREFAGRTLTVADVFKGHQGKTLFTERHYRTAFLALEAAGKVSCTPGPFDRPKRRGKLSMADHIRVTFPKV